MTTPVFENTVTSLDCAEPLRGWLVAAVESEASDLHLVAGYPPVLRIHGSLEPISGDVVEADQTADLLESLCSGSVHAQFLADQNLDFSFELEVDGRSRRFRANLFFSRGAAGACFRLIPAEIPSLDWAGFPAEIATRLSQFRNGLVLISGVAGSGKSTTLAMIVDLINREGGRRIITVEEPVEYVIPHCAGTVVTQREVGVDVGSFADGLKYGLRQDPDVILVGEIRDRDTAQMALTAAETGHVVFSTVHTRDAKGAVSRYADLFPSDSQGEIRAQLSLGLRAVVSQHLLPSVQPGEKRQLALEIMLTNSAISSAIRSGKLPSIDNCIQTGRAAGMVTLDARFVSDPAVLSG